MCTKSKTLAYREEREVGKVEIRQARACRNQHLDSFIVNVAASLDGENAKLWLRRQHLGGAQAVKGEASS